MCFLTARPTSPASDRCVGAVDLHVCGYRVRRVSHSALLRPHSGGAELEAAAGDQGGKRERDFLAPRLLEGEQKKSGRAGRACGLDRMGRLEHRPQGPNATEPGHFVLDRERGREGAHGKLAAGLGSWLSGVVGPWLWALSLFLSPTAGRSPCRKSPC